MWEGLYIDSKQLLFLHLVSSKFAKQHPYELGIYKCKVHSLEKFRELIFNILVEF